MSTATRQDGDTFYIEYSNDASKSDSCVEFYRTGGMLIEARNGSGYLESSARVYPALSVEQMTELRDWLTARISEYWIPKTATE